MAANACISFGGEDASETDGCQAKVIKKVSLWQKKVKAGEKSLARYNPWVADDAGLVHPTNISTMYYIGCVNVSHTVFQHFQVITLTSRIEDPGCLLILGGKYWEKSLF